MHADVTHAKEGNKRVALVIGNSSYRHVDHLANSGNDARLIAKTLQDLGFTLTGGGALLDLDHAAMTKAVEDFGRALGGAEVALFYYSGHGLQVRGVNWLVPVDANPTRPQDLDFQMLDADLVLRQMDSAGTKLNLLLLDACRNNPFASSGFRDLQSGLAEMRAPEGTLISYATQPGNVAADGTGSNSPYSRALADSMTQPGLDIFHLFNAVGLQVKRNTGDAQQPWVSSSPIDGDFFFTPAQTNLPLASVALSSPPPEPAAPVTAPSTRALTPPPCSVVDEHDVGDRVEVRGLAAAGPAWDAFAREAQGTRQVRVDIRAVYLLPDFACGLIDALAPAIRASRASTSGRPITLSQHTLSQGDALTITLRGVGRQAVQLDMFLPRGAVRHLMLHPALTAAGDAVFVLPQSNAEAPGPRVLAAIVMPSALDIGDRPSTEQAKPYLDLLRQVLPDSARVDIALFELRAKPVQAPSPTRGPRCSAIVERAQLGDTLSEADRAYLRTQCR